MKLIALAALAALAISPLVAQGGKTKPKPKTRTTIHCPVMSKHVVNIAKATKDGLYADYKGRRYFFCCGGCPSQFKANPDKYKKAESIPTPKK